MNDMLNTNETAEYLQVSASTLAQYRVSGRGPVFHKLGPAFVRYDRADLDEWAKSRRYKSTSEIAA